MGEGGKKDDDYDYVPFQGVEKGIVLQERRTFNETPLNAPKCCHLLTKILYLLHNGETFTAQEATDLFFAVTKLFQSQDVVLRRMTYLVLKELVHMAKDVIIVSASLSKDIAGKNENNKANAIRVLCQTLDDISLLGQQGERLLRQAIVDKDSYVATCALVSAYRLTHVSQQNNEIVKRWLQEISSASSNTDNTLVSYHALGLIYKLRQSDKQAVNRLAVSKATQHSKGINSPYEACLFIRIATTLIRENGVEQSQQLLQFLQNCKQGHTMVKFEAAKALCSLEDIVPPAAITTAISMLTSTLSGSSKTTCRASILRILNQLKTPVTNCQHELESLVSDSNLSVATLAISLLLKTGVEANVESHLKTLSNFMSDISDEFKCSVVDSIKGLCIKFPRKKTLLLNFLAKSLRDEGQLAYKTKVVETIFSIIKEIQNTKEEGLIHLCEFIEDCEYTDLSCRIIYFIGEEGPSTHCAHKYIRYLFNRVILENPSIRGAAVQALAKFARRCPELRNRIKILLRRCFGDSHAVVRELSLMQHKILQKEELYSFVDQPLPVPLENLQAALQKYLSMGPSDKAFDISLVPTFKSKPSPSSSSSSHPSAASKQNNNNNAAAAKEVQPQKSLYDALSSIPQLSTLGKRITSSKNPIELTESETEYNVTCVKHLFSSHLVLQFNCTNTLNDQLLENVYVKVQPDNEEFSISDEVPIETLSGGSTGSSYIILERGEGFPAATFSCTLKFLAKDVDSATGEADDNGYEDEYQLEDVEVGVSDYMSVWVPANFQEQWEEIGGENEAVETYSLSSIKSLKQACSEIADFLQMNPCDKTAYIDGKHSTAKHILHLGGKFLADAQVLARSRMKLNPSGGVDMELTVRSSNAEVNQALCNAI